MLSSVNPFGGLSAADISMLFGVSSSSSSSSTTSSSAAQSASAGVSASGANDPFTAIKTILAQAQIGPSVGGGSAISVTAEAAYAAQTGGFRSLTSASVTISSPGAAQQIADAVSEVNNAGYYMEGQNGVVDPTTGAVSYASTAVTVTASDAVNITMGDGAGALVTPGQGLGLPSGLPQPTTVQQALEQLAQSSVAGVAAAAKSILPRYTSTNGDFEDVTPTNLSGVAGQISQMRDLAIFNIAAGMTGGDLSNSVEFQNEQLLAATYDGSFTLVKLSPGDSLIGGDSRQNISTFYVPGSAGDSNGTNYALVLPQDAVSVVVSDTQIKG